MHPISIELGSAGGSISADSFSEHLQSSFQAKLDAKKAQATLSSKNSTLQKEFVLVVSVAPTSDTFVPNLLAPCAVLKISSQLLESIAVQLAFAPRDLCRSQNVVVPMSMEIVILTDLVAITESSLRLQDRAIEIALQVTKRPFSNSRKM